MVEQGEWYWYWCSNDVLLHYERIEIHNEQSNYCCMITSVSVKKTNGLTMNKRKRTTRPESMITDEIMVWVIHSLFSNKHHQFKLVSIQQQHQLQAKWVEEDSFAKHCLTWDLHIFSSLHWCSCWQAQSAESTDRELKMRVAPLCSLSPSLNKTAEHTNRNREERYTSERSPSLSFFPSSNVLSVMNHHNSNQTRSKLQCGFFTQSILRVASDRWPAFLSLFFPPTTTREKEEEIHTQWFSDVRVNPKQTLSLQIQCGSCELRVTVSLLLFLFSVLQFLPQQPENNHQYPKPGTRSQQGQRRTQWSSVMRVDPKTDSSCQIQRGGRNLWREVPHHVEINQRQLHQKVREECHNSRGLEKKDIERKRKKKED